MTCNKLALTLSPTSKLKLLDESGQQMYEMVKQKLKTCSLCHLVGDNCHIRIKPKVLIAMKGYIVFCDIYNRYEKVHIKRHNYLYILGEMENMKGVTFPFLGDLPTRVRLQGAKMLCAIYGANPLCSIRRHLLCTLWQGFVHVRAIFS